MATLPFQSGFDANTVEPQADLSPVPAGEYTAAITQSDMKPTKDGTGNYLEIILTVLDEGQYKGRKIWDRLNLVNKNQTAVEIAQRTLSAICHATGQMNVQDSQQLHNIPMKIKVSYVPPKDGFQDKNEVKAYKPLSGNAPVPAVSSAPQSAPAPVPQPAANTEAPPWKTNAA